MSSDLHIVTNSLGTGDYVQVVFEGETLFQAHNISPRALVDIIDGVRHLDIEHVVLVEATDDEMESGEW